MLLTQMHWYMWHYSCASKSLWFYHGVQCNRWLVHMCDMTHSYVWHDSRDITLSYVEWLIYLTLLTQMHWYMRHFSRAFRSVWLYLGVQCNRWLVHMCDMTHVTWLLHTQNDLYVWHYYLRCTDVCDITHRCAGVYGFITGCSVMDDSFICVTWLLEEYDMTLSCVI